MDLINTLLTTGFAFYRAFSHYFGNMTYTPGIGKFHVILPEIGNLFDYMYWGIKTFTHTAQF
jgi:hypothetical protein